MTKNPKPQIDPKDDRDLQRLAEEIAIRLMPYDATRLAVMRRTDKGISVTLSLDIGPETYLGGWYKDRVVLAVLDCLRRAELDKMGMAGK